MGDREEQLEDLAEGDPGRVVGDLDHLGVVGAAAADRTVVGRCRRVAGIARLDRQHPLELAVHGLGAPEAAAAQDDPGGPALLDRVQLRVGKGPGIDLQRHRQPRSGRRPARRAPPPLRVDGPLGRASARGRPKLRPAGPRVPPRRRGPQLRCRARA